MSEETVKVAMNLYESLKDRQREEIKKYLKKNLKRKEVEKKEEYKKDQNFEVGLKMFLTNMFRPLREVYTDFRGLQFKPQARFSENSQLKLVALNKSVGLF